MRILLFGCRGQVGRALQHTLQPLGKVIALDRTGQDDLAGNLEQPQSLVKTVSRVQPDVIVNAAAYTAVDQAEAEPDRARTVNAEAPAMLAQAAKAHNAWLVHYSTDYVFDGSGTRPWSETDTPRPLSVYGTTKLAGEQAIRESGCRHLIFRSSWIYAVKGKSFMHTMLELARTRDHLEVIDDQIGAPTGADLVADVTVLALVAVAERQELGGTYHLTAAGETSWYEYARFLIGIARRADWPVRVREENILPISSEAYPMPARRPRNSRLDCGHLQRSFSLELPGWREGVERTVLEIVTQYDLTES